MFFEEEGVPPDQLQLSYMGKPIEGEISVREYNITN
jgi:hypothetical protein